MSDAATPRFDWTWAGHWTLVFLANLPVPVLLAVTLLGSSRLLGLLAGLAVLYWVGLILCACRFRVGRSLVWGGWFIAVTQFVPILQLFCGAFGLGMWDEIGGQSLHDSDIDFDGPEPGWQGNRNLAAFTIVFFTAHPLLVLAVLIGTGARHLRRDHPIWRNKPANADPDAEE